MIADLFQSLEISIAIFVLSALAIVFAGARMSTIADRLADRTGWGEAVFGGIFLAAATSLPDFAATLTAAADNRPELAISNMVGSMAVNLAFLGIADIVYRKANLEHAAASSANLSQAALMIALLVIPLLAMMTPEVIILGVHPATLILFPAYAYGFRLVRFAHIDPMWRPKATRHTVSDRPDKAIRKGETLLRLWMSFGLYAIIVTVAGWSLMKAAETIAVQTVLSETQVGMFFTALFTSLPELVVTITAVRQGALTLAVGNILGTNCFNVIVIATSDIVYQGGSIYHAISQQPVAWGLLSILMTAVLILGFVRRQRFGIGKIGFESFLILLLYFSALMVLFFG